MTSSDLRDDVTLALASVGQRQLWMHDRLYAHDGSYNVPIGIRLIGPLDVRALRTALEAVVERHEPLRTTFTFEDGELYQAVASHQPVACPLVLVNPPDGGGWDHVQRALEADGAMPFDLAVGPLFRATLYELDDRTHALTVVVHHAVFDGWSVGVFLDELGACYEAAASGRQPSLPPLPVQFADFAEWQREQLETPDARPGLEYWARQVADATLRLELPFDRQPQSLQARQGRMVAAQAPPELRQALQAVCRGENVTLFVVLLSAFTATLHRYTKQADLLIGTPMAGRSRHELEPLIGMLINTVLIRSSVAQDDTFRDLLRRTRQQVLDAHTHQDIPYDRVLELIPRERSRERFQLQVLMALQSATPEPSGFGALDVSLFWGHTGTAKNDLFLNVRDESSGLRYELEYDVALFDEATAVRLLDSFTVLLRSAVAAPGTPVADLPLLSRADRALIDRVNATTRPFPRELGAHRLVARQAALTPDATAVVCGDTRWTYASLDARAGAIAHRLQSRGAGPGVLVGLCVERSADMAAALVAILRTGAAYLPIDPHYPAERIALVLEDSGTRLVVADRSTLAILPGGDVDVQLLEDVAGTGVPSDVPDDPERPAYVIYTSGSTGRPKGVSIPHRALVNFLTAMQVEPGFSSRDVIVAVTTLSFDIAALELLLPLVTGGQVTIASAEAAADPRQLRRLLDESRATVLQATPTTWRMLIESGWTGTPTLTALCGGEAMPPDLAEALLPRCAALWNMYGPTETTVWSLVRHLTGGPIDIGTPIANTDLVIVDERLRPVPVGVPGELLIGGEGLALGYQGRPDLTGERFVPHPERPGARAYRTGDLCRWTTAGRVEYLSRLDHQVKIRGFRIELGEIEAVLARHPGVRQAVVVAREDTPGERHLVAYIVVMPGQTPGSDELRAHLAASLPECMLPAAFVAVAAFPLTPNGKIDRKALPAPNVDALPSGEPFVAPREGTEHDLAAIWADVMGLERIGARDNFFHLGGHSLMAIRLFTRIRERMGVELPFGLLLQHPTVAALAGAIDERRQPAAAAASRKSAIVPLRASGSRVPIFFTHGIGGEVWSFVALARHLGDDQPVYGLQPVHDADDEATVAGVAARYVDEIRTVQPHGPYMLAGHCAGAAIALEMARQIRARGEQVGVVAAIDYWLGGPIDRRWHVRAIDFLRNLPHWIRDDLTRVSPATIMGRLRSAGRVASVRWRGLFHRGPDGQAADASVDIRDRLGMWRFPDYQVAALERAFRMFQTYEPEPFEGDMLVVRARTLPLFPFRVAPDMGWSRVVRGRIEIRDVKGSHETILQEPLVGGVASVLRDAMDRVPGAAPIKAPESAPNRPAQPAFR